MLGKLLCKIGLHEWRELYGELTEHEEDFLLRYCIRCGKLQEARHNFLITTGEKLRVLKTGRDGLGKVKEGFLD